MRGDLVLTNGVHTGKTRSETQARADFAATFGTPQRERPCLGFPYQGHFDDAMDRADAEAAQGPQQDEHVAAWRGHLHLLHLDYLDRLHDERAHLGLRWNRHHLVDQ